MFWPQIIAPDVLPQKQFKERRNCDQIVFLVENGLEPLIGFCVCSMYAQHRIRENLAFLFHTSVSIFKFSVQG